ncbi:uncharacterized protein LOC119324070 isoform X2 [Triticum dicoccoides]|uniref:uncharacterized protein LOC119324070 isoform X2 n=1 Tax=Triticum dicoccoides TaxID=85692 RepID=UPI001891EDDD|nr:uncharacterized protein LOC119324070 isoform X2 [Triticum dicoccoides]
MESQRAPHALPDPSSTSARVEEHQPPPDGGGGGLPQCTPAWGLAAPPLDVSSSGSSRLGRHPFLVQSTLRGGHLGMSTSGMADAGFRHALLLQHSVQFIPWGCRDAVRIVVAMWLDGSARAAPTLPSISFRVQFALKTEKGSAHSRIKDPLPPPGTGAPHLRAIRRTPFAGCSSLLAPLQFAVLYACSAVGASPWHFSHAMKILAGSDEPPPDSWRSSRHDEFLPPHQAPGSWRPSHTPADVPPASLPAHPVVCFVKPLVRHVRHRVVHCVGACSTPTPHPWRRAVHQVQKQLPATPWSSLCLARSMGRVPLCRGSAMEGLSSSAPQQAAAA